MHRLCDFILPEASLLASPPHRPCRHKPLMPGQRFARERCGVQTVCAALRARQIVLQQRAIIGMGAAIDHHFRALARGQAAQIGEALFGDDHLHILHDMVDMADLRHDGGNLAALRG